MFYTAADTILCNIVPVVVPSGDQGVFLSSVGILCKSQPLSGKWIVCLQDYILASVQAVHSTLAMLAQDFVILKLL